MAAVSLKIPLHRAKLKFIWDSQTPLNHLDYMPYFIYLEFKKSTHPKWLAFSKNNLRPIKVELGDFIF